MNIFFSPKFPTVMASIACKLTVLFCAGRWSKKETLKNEKEIDAGGETKLRCVRVYVNYLKFKAKALVVTLTTENISCSKSTKLVGVHMRNMKTVS